MLNCIKETTLYKELNLGQNLSHAYLLYSADRELNNNIALTFAKSLVCERGVACGSCPKCQQFESQSHPDVTIIDQDSIKVDDVNKIISKLSTLPLDNKYKIFVILPNISIL